MRTDRTTSTNSRTLVDAKMSLSLWLRAGRAQKGLSLEDVAKITKIQPRILERLEAGKLDGLPAEVFVRGFVKSFARCVGLDEAEALERYSLAAAATTATGTTGASVARAGALIESMSELAPQAARSPKLLRRDPEIIDVAPLAPLAISISIEEDVAPAIEVPSVEMMLPESGTLVMGAAESGAIEAAAEAVIEAPPVIAEEPVVVEAVATSVLEAAAAVVAPAVESTPAVVEAVIAAEVAAVEGVQLAMDAVATVEPAKKGGKRKRSGKRSKRASLAPVVVPRASASGTPAQPTPVVVEAEALAQQRAFEDAPSAVAVASDELVDATVTEPTVTEATGAESTVSETTVVDAIDNTADDTTAFSAPWTPKMPTVVAASVPWRRAAGSSTSTISAPVVPSLVIDDADPDSAERELEDRQTAKEPARRSFLPPILLDREDRSARQGGLTLAVIILLIAATLTLSYLMRRPSSTGDGVTQREAAAQHHTSIA